MTTPVPAPTTSPWFDEGLRAGAVLDDVTSVLVAGRDGEAAAWVALGLARAQAARRRVAVADLVGDAYALALPEDADDAPGIADSFAYGVSLNKVARPADEGGQLFVLPSGSEPVATDSIFRSDRWRRLASGFREAGALLVLAARADTPGVDALAQSVGHVVVAGDLGGALPDLAPPLAVIAPPAAVRRTKFGRGRAAARPTPAVAGAAVGEAPNGSAPHEEAAGDGPDDAARRTPAVTSEMVLLEPPAAPARRALPGTPRQRAVVLGLAGLTAAAGAFLWLAPKRLDTGARPAAAPPARPRAAPTAGASATPNASMPAAGKTSATSPNVPTPAPAVANGPPGRLAVANPADSAAAATYAVYIAFSNTADGASVDWPVDRTPPVLALTSVLQDGAPMYRLIVGAYRSRAAADSLLRDLRRRGVLAEESGSVIRAPYALLVDARVPAAEAARRVQALAARGVPTYPLSRGDGTVALYAGAFQTVDEAAYLARTARAAGVPTSLVYRTVAAP